MAMKREELKNRISALPLFEKRVVRVADKPGEECNDFTQQRQYAICAIGETRSYAYVHKNYKLVQFNEIFNPMLDSVEGPLHGYLINYGGYAALKLFPESENLKDGDDRFGIIAINSVDLSSSIVVQFCVKHSELHFTIPTKIAGLRKTHAGNVDRVLPNYLEVLGKVKEIWKHIHSEFPKYKVVVNLEKEAKDDEKAIEFGSVIEKLKIGKRIAKKLKESLEMSKTNGRPYTLWNIFLGAVEEVSEKNYKSDVHKQKKLDAICNLVFQYSMALGI